MVKKRWLLPVVVLAGIPLVAAWFALTNRGVGPARNVFLIVVDTLRPDRLSCYGFESHETPNIDRIAARGVRFANAFSNASWTVPSMGALMTSRYPSQLGLVEKPAGAKETFAPRERRDQTAPTLPLRATTLSEVLHVAGFHTAGFVNQPILNGRDGFVQGFDEWHYPVAGGKMMSRDMGNALEEEERTRARKTRWGSAEKGDSLLVDEFARWISLGREEKCFAWIHLLSPHRPYAPPARYVPAPPPGGDVENDLVGEEERYDGEIRYVDELIGGILAAIDSSVGLEHSLIIVTSDHGEEFGEHGGREHGHSLYGEVIRVPLVISFRSARLARPRSPVVNRPVRLIDVAPTVLRFAGVEKSDLLRAEGVDLFEETDGKREDDVYSEGMLYGGTKRSLLSGGLRLIHDVQAGRFHLFSVDDRKERDDLAGRRPEDVNRLARILDRRHRNFAREYADGIARTVREGGDVVDDGATADEAKREAERARRAMEALGYVGD